MDTIDYFAFAFLKKLCVGTLCRKSVHNISTTKRIPSLMLAKQYKVTFSCSLWVDVV